MNYLHITNRGLLDKNLISLMGGSTKTEDQFKIGQFGTGLKYTIAFLLRNNIHFKIFIDGEEVVIEQKKLVSRNTEFNVIYIDGERTSITTQMGLDWEAWMIVREIWCNALDEEDAQYSVTDIINPEKTRTQFYIQNVGEIKEVVTKWNSYFIHEVEPMFDNEKYSVYKNQMEGLSIYKNGVLIMHKKTYDKALFAYDIKNASINELREYKGLLHSDLGCAAKAMNERCVRMFIEQHQDYWEKNLDFDYSEYRQSFDNSWKKVLGEAKVITQKTKDHFISSGAIDQQTADETMVVVSPTLYKSLTDKFDSVSAITVIDKTSEFMQTDTVNPDLQDKINKAFEILKDIGYVMESSLTVKYGMFTSRTTLARIDINKKIIYISENMVDRSIFDNVAMLIEENEHFKTGFNDHTREFQQHFINLYVSEKLKANSVLL